MATVRKVSEAVAKSGMVGKCFENIRNGVDKLLDYSRAYRSATDEVIEGITRSGNLARDQDGSTTLAEQSLGHDRIEPVKVSPFEILDDPGSSGDGFASFQHGLWGRYGAAGILIACTGPDGVTRYLLTQSGRNSSEGNWQLPGGALHSKESPANGAAREAREELQVTREYLRNLIVAGDHVVGAPGKSISWKYTTIAVRAREQFIPIVDGTETVSARWLTDQDILEMKRNGELHSALAKNIEDILALYDRP